MELLRTIDPSYRAAAVAVALSAALHGAAVVGVRLPEGDEVSLDAPRYSATLRPAADLEAMQAPAARVAPAAKPRAHRPRFVPLPDEAVALLPEAAEAMEPFPAALEPLPRELPRPEILAMAKPSVPIPVSERPVFVADALPAELSINYALTSAFADGQAEYTWKREGDRYEITGSAQATGFFAVFLEGRIDQEASGRVTPEGLRPERFTERRGDTPVEGLSFDWDTRTVEFRKGDERRTGQLAEDTVDWLSMIFQLAHVPPQGDSMDLRVYTQRRLYTYRLQVLGVENLELPFGRAPALHLRHEGEKPEEAVDVWLGVEQHFLPVKLRYPIARNRLVVEQTATSVKAR
jgi:hypothetical protein